MKKPILIGIAGASGSGKTTAAWKIKTSSKDYEHVRLDNYLKHPRTFPWKKGFRNWESPSNIKFDLLLSHLKRLQRGKAVKIKIPAVITGTIPGALLVRPKKYIIVEGFVLFTNKKVRDFFDLKIFFNVPVRLISKRRKQRAKQYYNAQYDRQITIPEYLKTGLKQKKYADHVVNASLPAHTIARQVKKIIETTQS